MLLIILITYKHWKDGKHRQQKHHAKTFMQLELSPRTLSWLVRNRAAEHHTSKSENLKEVLRRQLALLDQNQVLPRLLMKVLDATHPLRTQFCRSVFESVKEGVLHSTDTFNMWNDNQHKENSSLIRMVLKCTDKTVTTSKTSAIIAFLAHKVLLNFDPKFCRYLIDHEYSLAGFLSVSATTTPYDLERQKHSWGRSIQCKSLCYSFAKSIFSEYVKWPKINLTRCSSQRYVNDFKAFIR